MDYQKELAKAIKEAFDASDDEGQILDTVYSTMRFEKGFMVSESDIEQAIKLIQSYEEAR